MFRSRMPPPTAVWQWHTAVGGGMAVASMVLGIISMFINPLTILGILALILGLVALPQTAGGVRRGRGMAIAGIILGCIAVIYFIWAMANYNVLMSLLFQ